MKITKINIQNYRTLKNITLDLEDNLSLIIGKNNTGKTSILDVLNKFLNSSTKNPFTIYDFNNDFYQKIIDNTLFNFDNTIKDENKQKASFGIILRLMIQCEEDDNNIGSVSKLITDLDEKNNKIILQYEYSIIQKKYDKLHVKLQEIEKNKKEKFIKNNINEYFKIRTKSFMYQEDTINKPFEKYSEASNSNLVHELFEYVDVEPQDLKDVIKFKYISAKRDVLNKENDKTLSGLSARYYKKQGETDDTDLEKNLEEANNTLDKTYQNVFNNVIKDIASFGGLTPIGVNLSINSSLEYASILQNNTTVKYDADNRQLPEHHNGLGYMNLIQIIFEIKILLHEFLNKDSEGKNKSYPLNILFIEEPEAHTHPQMQYIFINNIKRLLKCDANSFNLQTLITTHSAHIVSQSNFDDIKYLSRQNKDIIVKNLKSLKQEYEKDEAGFKFLKQYLTLHKSELFFADKIIFIEGDTERILLPTMMKKIDTETQSNDKLLSQAISVVEIGGAYIHIFEKLIAFLGIKTLVITDIDAVGTDIKKCLVASGTATSNTGLKFFYKQDFGVLKKIDFNAKKFIKNDNGWAVNENGRLCVTYQTEEDSYHARSFEDAFIHINKKFLNNKVTDNAYKLAEKILKKSDFAMDILLNSNDDFSNWKIPHYIKEGLEWLKNN